MMSYKWRTALICVCFFMCGLIHNLFYGAGFAELSSQIFCGAAVVGWVISIRLRVTDSHLRKLMTSTAFFFLMYLVFQTMKYRFFMGEPVLCRYAWYGFYVSMIAAAISVFYTAYECYRDHGRKYTIPEWLPFIAGCLIAAGIMSNDLHFLAFRFADAEMSPEMKTYGPLLYLFYLVFFTLLIGSAVIVFRKSRLVKRKRMDIFLQAVPVLIIASVSLAALAGKDIYIGGHKVWQMGESFCFSILAFLEMSIALGLIPANVGYERLFELSDLSAVMIDSEHKVRYASADVKFPFAEDTDFLIQQRPVSGGEIRWAVDVSAINARNKELAETSRRIEARNDYLSAEAKVRKAKAEIEERNRIYESITGIVKPQLNQIGNLMDGDPDDFDERLKDISVLCAYIKRRANMELIRENGRLPFDELTLALKESLSCLELKGVKAAVSASGEGSFAAELINAAYEQAEAVIEECLDSLKALMISVREKEGKILMRMMIRSDNLHLPAEEKSIQNKSVHTEMSFAIEDQDMILSFIFSAGGEQS